MFSLTKLRFVPARLRYVLASRSAAKLRSSRKWVRLTLERLEDRLTPSTLTVASAADDGSAGTLRAVLATANTDAANGISDTINFDPSLSGDTIVLTQGQLELSGASTTAKITIDGSGLSTPVTISGNNASRVFLVDSGVQAEFDDLGITDGTTEMVDFTSADGGGIFNYGTLTLSGCTVSNNSAFQSGGGISNVGTMTVSGCTFSGNTATLSGAGGGGAIASDDPLTVTNSTFSTNSSPSRPGGAIASWADLTISNCTFADNTAGQGGANGGAIVSYAGNVTILQSIFNDNAGYGGGIGILGPGSLAVSDSTFSGNTGYGGAINCGNATISGCTFDNNGGPDNGGAGAIFCAGTVTVSGCTFTDNAAAYYAGAITNNNGSLTISNSTFSGNSNIAVSSNGTTATLDISNSNFVGNYGGAIENTYGLVTLTDTTITGTTGDGESNDGGTLIVDHCAISDNPGGAIRNNGNTTVSDSTISDNGGPAIYSIGPLTIANSIFTGNYSSASVGAIYSFAELTVTNSTFSGNSAVGGGAIENYYTGSLTIDNSTLTGNSVGDSGGAILNLGTATITNCSITGNSGWVGGGVWNVGSFTISNSTVAGNTSANGAAGIGSSGALSIAQCTLTGNSTPSNGGAVYDVGSLTIQNSTIAGNGAGYGGGLCLNVNNSTPIDQMQVVNTIIADNTGTDPDIAGAFTSLDHNLIGDTTGGSGFAASDLLNVNPLLGPLQDNGGPTQTMALLNGSPAIDAGDNNNGGLPLPATDQRGLTRIVNGTIDIGAFEVQKTATIITVSSSATTPLLGDNITFTAMVTAATGTPSGSVDFFDSTTGTDLGSVSLANGMAALSTSALAVGNHTIVATYSGDNSFLSSQGSTTLTVLAPASLSGIVFEDFNDNGQVDFGELGIAGVTITLTGTDDLGQAVNQTQLTDGDGAYVFLNLRPGNYYLTETQPSGYLQGIDTIGTAGGSLSATDQFFVTLGQGTNGLNYNYGEQPAAGGTTQAGQTATIGFWNNTNGQALINSFNGGATSTQLGDWLAATLPNMFGANAGSNDLAGKSNAYIAALFQSDFLLKGVKLDAQVLATALSVYATNATLDNTDVAANYGFIVSGNGLGTASVNVGSNGAAFGVADDSVLTVLDLLKATDAQAVGGLLYNGDDTLRKEANNVYSAINEEGDIS